MGIFSGYAGDIGVISEIFQMEYETETVYTYIYIYMQIYICTLSWPIGIM